MHVVVDQKVEQVLVHTYIHSTQLNKKGELIHSKVKSANSALAITAQKPPACTHIHIENSKPPFCLLHIFTWCNTEGKAVEVGRVHYLE